VLQANIKQIKLVVVFYLNVLSSSAENYPLPTFNFLSFYNEHKELKKDWQMQDFKIKDHSSQILIEIGPL
jgi:penicillin-binding protein-related factor A (putative recombinase)